MPLARFVIFFPVVLDRRVDSLHKSIYVTMRIVGIRGRNEYKVGAAVASVLQAGRRLYQSCGCRYHIAPESLTAGS